MSNISKSILPPDDRSDLLLSIERAADKILAEYQPVNIWDVSNCPAHLLPYLAWSLSVDHWDEGWDIATQREIIRQNAQVHRSKGTIGAVRRILMAVGIKTLVQPWYEYGGFPGHLRVTALANETVNAGGIVDSAALQKIWDTIETVKMARTDIEVIIGAEHYRHLGVVRIARNAVSLARTRSNGFVPGKSRPLGVVRIAHPPVHFARHISISNG